MKPIHKFNNGNGATLCHSCTAIIDHYGLNNHLLCPKCQERAINLLKTIKEDAMMALDNTWDRSDNGFEVQLQLIDDFLNEINDD